MMAGFGLIGLDMLALLVRQLVLRRLQAPRS
jgi:hypothetical protein